MRGLGKEGRGGGVRLWGRGVLVGVLFIWVGVGVGGYGYDNGMIDGWVMTGY